MQGLYGRVRQMVTRLNMKNDSELYQVLFDTAAAGIVSINSEGSIQACNPALCRIFGYEAEELLGQNIAMLMPVRHGQRHQNSIRQYLREGKATVMGRGRELPGLRKSGEEFLLHLSVSEMNLAGARSFTAIVHDLTSTQSDHQRLPQGDQAWLGSVLDHTPAAVTVKDMQGRYLLLNHRAESLLGIHSRDATGRTDSELFTPQWAALQQRTDAEVSHADGARVFIEPFVGSQRAVTDTPDRPGTGQRAAGAMSFLTSKNVLRDGAGEAMGIVAIRLDISALPVLSRSAPGADVHLLNVLPQPLALLTSEGEVLQANDAYGRRFGLSARSVTGCNVQLLESEGFVQWFRHFQVLDGMQESRWQEDDWQLQLQIHLQDGQKLILLTATPHLAAASVPDSGSPQAFATDSQSLTDNARFIAGLSHELRTPLNAVIGFSQLLKAELHHADQKEAIELIERAGKHLVALVDQVLDLVKIEGHVHEPQSEAVALLALLDECQEMVRGSALARGIRIRIHSAVAEPWVCADRVRCKQIVLNLLSNAIKYNRADGHVDIRVESTVSGRLRISICDTGCGIAVERQADLFMPFQRLGAEQGSIEGSGLGLVISRVLASRMNGVLDFSSREGEGSCFWLELPQATPLYSLNALTPLSDVACANATNTSAALMADPLRRVLYIEDNPINARFVELGLKRRDNLEVAIARTGQEGVNMALQHTPDVILLDMRLPDIHGLDVLKKLRAIPELRGARIYGVSADALPDQIRQAQDAGVDGYMTKPFDLQALGDMIDSPRQ
ncbi:MAG: PAS domain S-box protein [Saccharospirillaceae bacterium]|nr:PAS domain S-box protein [Saccharospirillaceae bacterium]MCD8531405.1 PAS domain S-box protein [Saccharospirillaceae bacterium]